MSGAYRIEVRPRPDEATLAGARALVARVAAADGYPPLGEHKQKRLEQGTEAGSAVLAHDRDGGLAGYAFLLWDPPGGAARLAVECAVPPSDDRPVVLERLLEATERVLAEAGGGRVWFWMHHVDDPGGTLAARLGWDVQRDLAFMQRPLAARPDPGPAPEGVRLRAYREPEDDEEFLRVNNAAFVGHPENGGWDRAEFSSRRSREWFDAADLLMAWRDDRLVGFHWTKVHPAGTGESLGGEVTGEVYVLAVDPAAHGGGLGKLLLAAGLRHLHDRGCRRVVLYVDLSSPKATRLYESAGFEVTHHEVCYERAVPAGGG